ncbi:MAG TPA: TrbG/VirB9 family P-type conjugative transfer protein [Pseudoduganella sp.]
MSRRLLSSLVGLALVANAHSAQIPEAGKKDARIRFATYDPYDVVTIYARYGMETHIVLDADETVVDMTGGDTEAWGVATKRDRNGLFIKPSADLPDSNIHVVTNRRTYTFDLKLARKGKRQIGFMTVFFRYPTAERAADGAATEVEQVRGLLDAASPVGNRRYTVQGSSDLTPIEVWDDGRSTYLRFRARSGIPAFYAARGDDDSLEQIENPTVKHDVVQLPGVRRKFVLRIGNQVACVFNEGYDPNASRPATNTASPYVKRTLKGTGR